MVRLFWLRRRSASFDGPFLSNSLTGFAVCLAAAGLALLSWHDSAAQLRPVTGDLRIGIAWPVPAVQLLFAKESDHQKM